LCIDTTDPAGVAGFWESALGWHRTFDEEDQVCLEPPEDSPEDGIAPDLVFLKVPEGKTIKNRLHLDLRPADQSAEVARLEALGARQVSIGAWPDVTRHEQLACSTGHQPLHGRRADQGPRSMGLRQRVARSTSSSRWW
jgi:Glyoxalase-like domain